MSTGTPTGTPAPGPAPRPPIPTWIFVILMLMQLTNVCISFYYLTGLAATINAVLFGVACGALWLIWVTPSAANEIDGKETFLCVILVLLGMAIGSSPGLYPSLARLWDKAGLQDNAVPLGAPKLEYWSWDPSSRMITPTDKLPAETDLLVLLPENKHGIFVDDTGYTVPDDVEVVKVFLQHRVDGRTSSSVSQKTPKAP